MGTKKNIRLIVGAVIASSFLAITAFAADDTRGASRRDTFPEARPVDNRSEMKPSVGILAGYSALNGGAYSNNAGAILEAGFQPYVPFGLSAQFQYSPGDVNVAGFKADLNTTNLLAKATYNFGGDIAVIRNSYIGLKTGATIYSGDFDSSTHYALGPVIGFDIPVDVHHNLTLGAEGTYLGVMGDNSPDQVSALGAVKYWF